MKNRMHTLKLTLAICAACAASVAGANDKSVVLGLQSHGIGLSYSQLTPWSLREGDQIQARMSVAGIAVDDADDVELSGIDYKGDVSHYTIQVGLDWYPFSGNIIDNTFFSTGFNYTNSDIDVTSEKNANFSVGSTRVRKADDVRLNADLNSSSIAPYFSLGWGNRLRGESGFSFHSELGLYVPLRDPSVNLTASDPNNVLSGADLAKERRDIEDDIGDVNAFISFGVGYQF